MQNKRIKKRLSMRLVSVFLMLSVIFSLAVPFDLTVFAAEEDLGTVPVLAADEPISAEAQAASDDIRAYLCKINGSSDNLNLVFQNSAKAAPADVVYGPYGGDDTKADYHFASKEYYKQWWTVDSNRNPNISWQDSHTYADGAGIKPLFLPWHVDAQVGTTPGNKIKKITFREEIKPLSIASWFYSLRLVESIEGLENLNTENCRDMTFAFYNFCNAGNSLTELDLSHFVTSEVRQCNRFFKSDRIRKLDLSNFDFSHVGRVLHDVPYNSGGKKDTYVSAVWFFVYNSSQLRELKIDNVDLSGVRSYKYFISNNTSLQSLDLSNMKKGPSDAYMVEYMFYGNTGMESIELGSADVPFEVGTSVHANRNGTAWEGVYYPYTEVAVENGYLSDAYKETHSCRNISMIYFSSMLSDNSSLKELNLEHFLVPGYRTDKSRTTSPEDYYGTVALQYASFLQNCSSLEHIYHLDKLFNVKTGGGEWHFKRFFNNCSSLEEIDLSANTLSIGLSELIFNNCSSLKSLDLSGLMTDTYNWYVENRYNLQSGFSRLSYQKPTSSDDLKLYSTFNIYNGCEELSEIRFSPYYPQHSDETDSSGYNYGSGYNIPPEKTWIKLENPETGDYPAYDAEVANKTKNAYTGTKGDSIKLSSSELFGNFKPEYAGKWVAVASIILDADGGTPDKQYLDDNSKGMPLNYQTTDITVPQKTGYTFDGWYSEKEGEGEALPAPNTTDATAWTYYAKWIENTYTLVLDGNSGGTIASGLTAAKVSSDSGISLGDDPEDPRIVVDTQSNTITFKDLKYTEYLELNKKWFNSDSPGETILTGWGDRRNGAGDNFGVSESVSKLTPESGGEVKLYALWNKPQAIITFDSNDDDGDTAHVASTVNPISYDSADAPFGTLPEVIRDSYTFSGWYKDKECTESKKVTAATTVGQSQTLYAKWVANPTIKFDANGGKFLDDSTLQTKVCKAGSAIGVLPSPLSDDGKAFEGWYDNAEGTGTAITSSTLAQSSWTYYAKWRYHLEVNSNGGYFTDDFTGYPFVSDKDYKVWIHSPIKDGWEFGGWYTDKSFTNAVSDGETLDLSVNNKIYAKWIPTKCTVTLNANGGTLSAAQSSIEVYSGHTLGELPTPVKSGCIFDGWYDDDTDTKYTKADVISSDITLTAHWSAVTAITFVGSGGTFVESGSTENLTLQAYTEDNKLKLSCPPGINYDKKYFVGWYDQNDQPLDLNNVTGTEYHAVWSATPAVKTITEGGYDIEYYVVWRTESDVNATNNGDTLIFHPTTSNSLKGNIEIYFKWTGGTPIPAGGLKIYVPQRYGIVYNWNGANNGADTNTKTNAGDGDGGVNFTVSNGQPDPSDSNTWYVYTNKAGIDTATESSFQLDYTIAEPDTRKTSGGYVDENGIYRTLNEYNVRELPITIKVGDITKVETLKTETHTKIDTPTINKTRATVLYEWQDAWTTQNLVPKPVDPENYFFIRWNLDATVPATSSQRYQYMWSEDCVHDGLIVYRGSNVTINNAADNSALWSGIKTGSSTTTTTVVTMHRRDESRLNGDWANVKNEVILNIKWASSDINESDGGKFYVSSYRESATVNAYIGPQNGEGPRYFFKRTKDFLTNHYINGGQELVQSGLANDIDGLIYDYSFTEKAILDESQLSWNNKTGTYTASPRRLTITDGEKGRGDVVISPKNKTDSTGSWNRWGASGQQTLADGDYYFSYITLRLDEYDAILLQDEGNSTTMWSDPYLHEKRTDYGDTLIYVRYEGESDFEFFKAVTVNKGYDDANGVEVQLSTATRKAVGFKVIHDSSFAVTQLRVSAQMKLNNTRRVTDIVNKDIGRNCETVIKNKATFDENYKLVNPSTGEVTLDTTHGHYNVSSTETASDATEYSYFLTIGSSYIYAKKDISTNEEIIKTDANGVINIPCVISGWGYNNSGNIKRMNKCVFRDMLPTDFVVDKSSVFAVPLTQNYKYQSSQTNGEIFPNSVKADNYDTNSALSTVLPSSYISVEFEPNKNNTGRTMMVVTVTIPDTVIASGVSVYYKMKTTQKSLLSNNVLTARNTLNPQNYVSFRDLTEYQSIPVDRSEKISRIDPKLVDCYSNIDDELTAYAYAETSLSRPPVSTTSISSVVSAEGSTLTRHENVGLNMPYSYYVYYSNFTSTSTQKMVFYDVLEHQIKGDLQSEWSGTFKSVDTSGISKTANSKEGSAGAKCSPVVYYSVKPKDQFSAADFWLEKDGDKNPIWTTTPPADLSTVTAVAVDCRKDVNGVDFVLGGDMFMSFNINMNSPLEGTNNTVAYNNAYIYGYNNSADKEFDLPSTTDVTLHYQDPVFEKTAYPGSGTVEVPNRVVMGSTLEYILTVTNPDAYVPMNNIVVEDVFNSADVELKTGGIKIQLGDETPISVSSSPLITASSTAKYTEEGVNKTKFTATIASVEPEQTVRLILPVTVNATEGTPISNTAQITSINGVVRAPVESNTTYHVASSVVAKILKVNERGEAITGAKLQLQDAEGDPIELKVDGVTQEDDFFYSGETAKYFDVAPGTEYKLVELETPSDNYLPADPIIFTVDQEGFHHIGSAIEEQVEMTDRDAFHIIFHENQPDSEDDVTFRTYGPADLNDSSMIDHFYDLPDFAGDEYVFKGWYHTSGWSMTDSPDDDALTAVNFDSDQFIKSDSSEPQNYHIYAKWIPVGVVSQAEGDKNNYGGVSIRGFGIAGVQIRDPGMVDPNYQNAEKPQGMRFITSLSEDLFNSIKAVSSSGVEYGYVVGTETNINSFIDHYGVKDTTKYKLQYNGFNVNGVNTNAKDDSGADLPADKRNASNDFRYITNVNCTSNHGGTGIVQDDHQNFNAYRLYTLVVTYENEQENKSKKLDARAYIRYTDANGKMRVFYNDYRKNMYYGGCLCSFNQVSELAIPKSTQQQETE